MLVGGPGYRATRWGKRQTTARDMFRDAELDERLELRGGRVRWRGEEVRGQDEENEARHTMENDPEIFSFNTPIFFSDAAVKGGGISSR